MSETTFFRLLKTPIEDKGDQLAAQVAALNAAGPADETFTADPAEFNLIPGSPFAYWVGPKLLDLFVKTDALQEKVSVCSGPDTSNDYEFLRTFWEVSPARVGHGNRWIDHPKGGAFSPYYADVHVLIDWQADGEAVRERGNIRNPDYYFRPGLTWPLRTQKGLNFRAMPAGCIFGHKGPGVFVEDDDIGGLSALLAITNSTLFQFLVKLQMAFGSYEVGVIQRTPITDFTQQASCRTLASLAHDAYDLQRDRDRTDETTHAFYLPGLIVQRDAPTLLDASLILEAEAQGAEVQLTAIQAEIDEIVFDLYELGDADCALVRAEMSAMEPEDRDVEAGDDANEEEIVTPEDLPAWVQDLLMWCVGVAFGRWDLRMALDPSLLPALQGPFDPLPRCAPGALVGTDGLPPARVAAIAPEDWLRARENVLDLPPAAERDNGEPVYPLPIAWDGIMVDDPDHPGDIVARVRGVLALLWGQRAGAIEREACEILGFKTLRDYFRDPRKGFFPFHIKRYSKSRRKAPIYWLLQSEKRAYGIWLYIHRMDKTTLYTAGRDYADAKVALEESRLEELKVGLEMLSGAARRRREREIERQAKLVAEVTDFRDRLDAAALRNLLPDLNDGVVISIAPLWELVPWQEAEKHWQKLLAGEYEWSTMSQQMRARGWVK